MTTDADRTSQVVTALIEALGRDRVLTGGSRYDAARQIWNRAIDASPAAIVQCRNEDEVRSAVRIAAAAGCSLSVKGGGHHWAGRALTGRIVIDLTPMRQVDITGDLATIAGGAKSLDVAAAAQDHGLAAVTGNLGAIGYVGYLTGGGYGPLTGRCGLASDSLVSARIVTAGGELLTASESENADLFWALRGGGESFGVVTSLTVQLYPAADLLAGVVMYPWEQAAEAAQGYDRIALGGADELTLTAAFAGGPDGAPILAILPAWSGAPEADDRIADALHDIGPIGSIDVARKAYVEMLGDAKAFIPDDTSALNRTVTLRSLNPEVIRAIIAAVETRTSPFSYVVVHPFHGAGEHVPPDATAFGLRSKHYVVGICAVWREGEPAEHRAWADAIETALLPYGIDSTYPNYAGIDRLDGRLAPNGRDEKRFAAVRRHYDPAGVFKTR